jgi:hypothetical protein
LAIDAEAMARQAFLTYTHDTAEAMAAWIGATSRPRSS